MVLKLALEAFLVGAPCIFLLIPFTNYAIVLFSLFFFPLPTISLSYSFPSGADRGAEGGARDCLALGGALY